MHADSMNRKAEWRRMLTMDFIHLAVRELCGMVRRPRNLIIETNTYTVRGSGCAKRLKYIHAFGLLLAQRKALQEYAQMPIVLLCSLDNPSFIHVLTLMAHKKYIKKCANGLETDIRKQ